MAEVDCSRKHLRQNCMARLVQTFERRIDFSDEQWEVSLNQILLLGVSLYRHSLWTERKMSTKLIEKHIKCAERVADFEREAGKKVVLSEVSNTSVWNACLRKSSLDTCSQKKGTVQDVFWNFQCIKNYCRWSRCHRMWNWGEERKSRKPGIVIKAVENSTKLKPSKWRKCPHVSIKSYSNV